jgi:hypothetical protein
MSRTSSIVCMAHKNHLTCPGPAQLSGLSQEPSHISRTSSAVCMVLTRTISHLPDQHSCLHGSPKNHLTCPGPAQLSAFLSQEPSHISQISSAVRMALTRTVSHVPDQLSYLHGSHKNHLTCPGPAQLSAWFSQEPSHMSRTNSSVCVVLTRTNSHVPDQLSYLHGTHKNHLTCPGPSQLSAWLSEEPSHMSRTSSAVCMALTRTISHVPYQLSCLHGSHKNHLTWSGPAQLSAWHSQEASLMSRTSSAF